MRPLRPLEPVDLDQPLPGQFRQAKIDLSQADPHLRREITLGHLRVLAQQLEEPVSDFSVDLFVHGVNI